MKMKNIFLALFISGFFGTAHAQLNDYKYIVVPKKFDEFKRQNQYQTSTLIKYLLDNEGFNVVYDDQLPNDLNSNRCLGVWANLIDNSSMFSTKTTLKLTDCMDREVFTTQEGKSKIKEFKPAYSDAIRQALSSFNTISYAYNGNAENTAPVTANFQNDVKNMEEKREVAPKNAENAAVVQETSTERQTYKNPEPVSSNISKAESVAAVAVVSTPAVGAFKKISGTLYAQELPNGNGYQLVDSTPQIVMQIFKTSVPGNYLAKKDGTDGVLLEKNGKWIFEYHENGNLKSEELDIKF